MGSLSTPVMNPGAGGYYQQQLGLMMQNYGNIQNAYTQAQSNAGNQLQGIYSGYSGLGKDINSIAAQGYNVGAQSIKDTTDQTLAQQKSAAVNAGFRSTAQLALQNQAQGLAGRNYANLAYQISNEASGRQQQIGLAGLAAQQQGVGQQLDLARSYMGNLAGYNFSPRVDLYGQQSINNDAGRSGGYGGGSGASSMSGGSPFSSWLSGSGVPMYGGTAGNLMGYAGGYYQGPAPSYTPGYYGGSSNFNLGASDPDSGASGDLIF